MWGAKIIGSPQTVPQVKRLIELPPKEALNTDGGHH